MMKSHRNVQVGPVLREQSVGKWCVVCCAGSDVIGVVRGAGVVKRTDLMLYVPRAPPSYSYPDPGLTHSVSVPIV